MYSYTCKYVHVCVKARSQTQVLCLRSYPPRFSHLELAWWSSQGKMPGGEQGWNSIHAWKGSWSASSRNPSLLHFPVLGLQTLYQPLTSLKPDLSPWGAWESIYFPDLTWGLKERLGWPAASTTGKVPKFPHLPYCLAGAEAGSVTLQPKAACLLCPEVWWPGPEQTPCRREESTAPHLTTASTVSAAQTVGL